MKRTIGHFNREARLDEIRRRRQNKSAAGLQDSKAGHTTPGSMKDLQ